MRPMAAACAPWQPRWPESGSESGFDLGPVLSAAAALGRKGGGTVGREISADSEAAGKSETRPPGCVPGAGAGWAVSPGPAEGTEHSLGTRSGQRPTPSLHRCSWIEACSPSPCCLRPVLRVASPKRGGITQKEGRLGHPQLGGSFKRERQRERMKREPSIHEGYKQL